MVRRRLWRCDDRPLDRVDDRAGTTLDLKLPGFRFRKGENRNAARNAILARGPASLECGRKRRSIEDARDRLTNGNY